MHTASVSEGIQTPKQLTSKLSGGQKMIYAPEGSRLHTPENQAALRSISAMEHAMHTADDPGGSCRPL